MKLFSKVLLTLAALQGIAAHAVPLTITWARLSPESVEGHFMRLELTGVLDRPDAGGHYASNSPGNGIFWVRYPGTDWKQLPVAGRNDAGLVVSWQPNSYKFVLFNVPTGVVEVKVCHDGEACSNPYIVTYVPHLTTSSGNRVGGSVTTLALSVDSLEFAPLRFVVGTFDTDGVFHNPVEASVSCSSDRNCVATIPPSVLAQPGEYQLTASGPMGSSVSNARFYVWSVPVVNSFSPNKLTSSADANITFNFRDALSIPEASYVILNSPRCTNENVALTKGSGTSYSAIVPSRCLTPYGQYSINLSFSNFAGAGSISIPVDIEMHRAPIPGRPPIVTPPSVGGPFRP